MVRILKFLVVVAALAVVGLTGYAYLGDMAPAPQDVHQPVDLNVGG